MEQTSFATPIGTMKLEMDQGAIKLLEFTDDELAQEPKDLSQSTLDAVAQLMAYFDGELTSFDLPIAPDGTEFQKKVWQELLKIPFGKTISYQEMANRLGDPLVIRAAASANGKNPIAIIIPCHRVIGSNGSLTGYAGGLHRKKWLLAHEQPLKQTSLFD